MQKQQPRSGRAAPEGAPEPVTHQRISMYREPPSGEVCIEEFETFAIDRLRGTDNCPSSPYCSLSNHKLLVIYQDAVFLALIPAEQSDLWSLC